MDVDKKYTFKWDWQTGVIVRLWLTVTILKVLNTECFVDFIMAAFLFWTLAIIIVETSEKGRFKYLLILSLEYFIDYKSSFRPLKQNEAKYPADNIVLVVHKHPGNIETEYLVR